MEYLYAILQNLGRVINQEKIERSKPTWTQVRREEANSFKANLELFKTLQQHPNWGRFFHTFREGELVVGEKLAEGSQAEIFEAKIICHDPTTWSDVEWVLKVFKKGDALQDLKRQWPEGMLKHHAKRVEVQNGLIQRYNCDIQCGTLLPDGRFAFLMQREESDLRTIIDEAVKMRTDPDSAPFPEDITRSSIHDIAEGMDWLHSRDIIHRDLKAANVLVRKIDGRYCFFVADYECSVGVMGTEFWRAPEILKVCKESRAMHRPALPVFTRAADVYSFGMTCFEILTGKLPFEDIPVYNYDHVLNGNRPEVPKHVDGWACDLLRKCWKHDPSERPSFEQILSFLSTDTRIEGDAGNERKAYWTALITEFISKYELEEAGESNADERIEDSKVHWSMLSECSSLDDEENFLADNVETFEILQTHPVWGSFFMKFSDDELVVGEKFAEGGQAELYHVEVNWENQFHHEAVLKNLRQSKIVAKVFKKGTLLKKLQSQFPQGMLQYCAEKIEQSRTGTPIGTMVMYQEWEKPRHISNVLCLALLEDGRFGFLMDEEYSDLRTIIEKKMQWKIGNDCGPFSKDIAEGIMHDIALGLNVLHSRNIIHRDLKASNVLVREVKNGSYEYLVADYECSIGVVGTGFFRAPEVLQACKDKNVRGRPELFTKAIDIYSYGMTCYEILTGKLPFEGHPTYDYDIVLSGQRPKVPKYVDFWARGLLNMCWEPNPDDRPSILDILQEFKLHRGRTSS